MRHRDGDEAVAVCETSPDRGVIEVLRMRAHLLAGEERALLEAYLERGSSFRQIGRLMGLDPRNVGRRVRGIVRRLTDDTYEICLGNHDDFNGRELAVIRDHFVGGVSERHISRHRAVPRYRVRAILQKAQKYAASKRRENP
jgi:hypothetical protein